jgi:hypothetical protein
VFGIGMPELLVILVVALLVLGPKSCRDRALIGRGMAGSGALERVHAHASRRSTSRRKLRSRARRGKPAGEPRGQKRDDE